MLFCSIKGANRGYIQVLLATSRNRIYFRRRSSKINVLFCSIKGANRGYIQVLLATSRNRIYFRRRSNRSDIK
ncbi:hypothetical protein [Cardinium endosymbiont of Tipula unca]|uniref:hypothetical protein n=1 Tax=Cardinium endosymbiont of Tipula unca TaxID=3066216 RepID=UPI0030D30B5C